MRDEGLLKLTGITSVPQVRLEDGRTFVQDTADIFDTIEAAHPSPPALPDASTAPRQRLCCYLVELLADEWLIVWGSALSEGGQSHAASDTSASSRQHAIYFLNRGRSRVGRPCLFAIADMPSLPTPTCTLSIDRAATFSAQIPVFSLPEITESLMTTPVTVVVSL